MARFGDLEAAIMDAMWAAAGPLRVREVADELNRDRPLAFNTVQTVIDPVPQRLAGPPEARPGVLVCHRAVPGGLCGRLDG